MRCAAGTEWLVCASSGARPQAQGERWTLCGERGETSARSACGMASDTYAWDSGCACTRCQTVNRGQEVCAGRQMEGCEACMRFSVSWWAYNDSRAPHIESAEWRACVEF